MRKYFENCEKIYSMLGDEQSKEIYENRIMYSLTNAEKYRHKIVESSAVGRRLIQEMRRHEGRPVIVYGAGMRGEKLINEWDYNWKGMIDNNPALWGKGEKGIPIMSLADAMQEFPNMAVVLTNKFENEQIEHHLIEAGIKKECIMNIGAWIARMTEDIYFDLPQLVNTREEVFVDLGGYDGLSSRQFVKWCNGEFEHIYCFEPDIQNSVVCMGKIRECFAEEQLTFIQKGTWNKVGQVPFDGAGTEGSKIDDKGKDIIQVTTLDEELEGKKVTYIKMDIEGAELETLEGARGIIKNQTPKLAISVYHKKSDIFTIPQTIREYSSQYTFYLRHYTFDIGDTVLYAIPPNI